MDKKKYLILPAVLLLIILIIPLLAYSASPEENLLSRDIVVTTETDGPLFASGQRVKLDSEVTGPVFLFGDKIIINGKINGSVFLAGNSVTINGEINGDLFAAGNLITLETPSTVNHDAFLAGNSILINNSLSRHVMLAASDFSLGEDAKIGGNLYYNSSTAPSDTEDKVMGKTVHSPFKSSTDNSNPVVHFLMNLARGLFSFGLMGFLLNHFTKKRWLNTLTPIMRRPVATFSMGVFVSVITVPILLLMILVIVFQPFALMTIFILGLITTTSVMIVSFAMTRNLSSRYPILKKYNYLPGFALFYTLHQLVMAIPYFGVLIRVIIFFYAMGNAAMNLYMHEKKQKRIFRNKEKFLYDK